MGNLRRVKNVNKLHIMNRSITRYVNKSKICSENSENREYFKERVPDRREDLGCPDGGKRSIKKLPKGGGHTLEA